MAQRRQSQRFEQRQSLAAGFADGALAEQGADGHVFCDAEGRKRPGRVEDAGDAETGDAVGGEAGDFAAVEADGALVGPESAGDHIQQGGFAGAAGADQGEALACGQRQRNLDHGGNAVETFGHRLEGQKLAHSAPSRSDGGGFSKPSRRARPGHRPSGAAMATSTSARPAASGLRTVRSWWLRAISQESP